MNSTNNDTNQKTNVSTTTENASSNDNTENLNPTQSPKQNKFLLLLPGLLLCFVIAVICWFLGKWVPVIGGSVFAILMGMFIALFYKNKTYTQAGITYSGKKYCNLPSYYWVLD